MIRREYLVICAFLYTIISVGSAIIFESHTSAATPTTTAAHSECYGTHSGLSFSGSQIYHYRHMRQRYAGCTHVIGNLEIRILNDESINYDLSFLSNIRYVSGYVLIAVVTHSQEIPLHSLEVIRGNYTFPFLSSHYALAVLLTYPKGNKSEGLKELQLPSLKEITNGRVVFYLNPSLGFVDTIDWDAIVRHRPNAVDFMTEPYNASVSSTYGGPGCPSGRMWGRGLCQADIPHIPCHSSCDGRCFGSASDECCHATCAVGCNGPTNQDCIMCKDYEYNSGCVGFCPARSYPDAMICVPY